MFSSKTKLIEIVYIFPCHHIDNVFSFKQKLKKSLSKLDQLIYSSLYYLEDSLFKYPFPLFHLCVSLCNRQYKTWNKMMLGNPSRGVIDGELVWQYLNLPVIERQEIAKKIGTKVDEIMDDLGEIERVTAHF